MSDTRNVSVVKGVAGGYCYIAPYGTALPTDFETTLDTAFVNIGYISDAGVTHTKSASNTDFFDMNGDAVESANGETTRTVTQKFIEISPATLGEAYGASNVTTTQQLISYVDKNELMALKSIVYELVLKNGRRFRRVVPCAKVTEWGDQVDVSTDLGGFELTYTKYADSNNAFEYGYIEPVA